MFVFPLSVLWSPSLRISLQWQTPCNSPGCSPPFATTAAIYGSAWTQRGQFQKASPEPFPLIKGQPNFHSSLFSQSPIASLGDRITANTLCCTEQNALDNSQNVKRKNSSAEHRLRKNTSQRKSSRWRDKQFHLFHCLSEGKSTPKRRFCSWSTFPG